MKKIDKNSMPFFLRWLAPDYWASSTKDVSYPDLKKEGVKTVVFDIDSTLTPFNQNTVDPEVLESIQKAQRSGSIGEVAIATNRRRMDFVDITLQLGDEIEYVYALSFFNAKPFKKYFKRLFRKLHTKPKHAAMIGDKLFTDMIGAKRFGMVTVHVDRLGEDSVLDKLTPFRYIERWIVARYHR